MKSLCMLIPRTLQCKFIACMLHADTLKGQKAAATLGVKQIQRNFPVFQTRKESLVSLDSVVTHFAPSSPSQCWIIFSKCLIK